MPLLRVAVIIFSLHPTMDDRMPVLAMTSTRERLLWEKGLLSGLGAEGQQGGDRGCFIC